MLLLLLHLLAEINCLFCPSRLHSRSVCPPLAPPSPHAAEQQFYYLWVDRRFEWRPKVTWLTVVMSHSRAESGCKYQNLVVTKGDVRNEWWKLKHPPSTAEHSCSTTHRDCWVVGGMKRMKGSITHWKVAEQSQLPPSDRWPVWRRAQLVFTREKGGLIVLKTFGGTSKWSSPSCHDYELDFEIVLWSSQTLFQHWCEQINCVSVKYQPENIEGFRIYQVPCFQVLVSGYSNPGFLSMVCGSRYLAMCPWFLVSLVPGSRPLLLCPWFKTMVYHPWFPVQRILFQVPSFLPLTPGLCVWWLVPGSWFPVSSALFLVAGSWSLIPHLWCLVSGFWFTLG